MRTSTNINGLSIIPVVFLFSTFISIVGIRLPLQVPLVIILLMGYILVSRKIYFNSIIVVYFIFFLWVTVLFLRGNVSDNRMVAYMSYIMAVIFMLGVYYYALYHGIKHFRYYVYMYIFISFFIAFLEVRFDFIVPTSGRDQDPSYVERFAGVPMSTFFNPNNFVTAVGMLFVYMYSYCEMMKHKIRYLLLICFMFMIFFAGSRGVQIVLIFLPLVYSVVNRKTSGISLKTIMKLLIFYFFGFVTFYYLLRNNMFSDYNMRRIEGTIESIGYGAVDNSTLIRFTMIVYTLTNLGRLIIGFGPGGSLLFFEQFPIPNPHNFFIEVLVDFGFIGLTLTIIIFIIALRENNRLLREDIPSNLRASCKATIILLYFFIVFSVIPSSLLMYWMFAWLPIYLTLINIGSYNREVSKKRYQVLL